MTWKFEWIAFDTETTGFGPKARIVSIALALFQRGELVSTQLEHFNPEPIDWGSPDVRHALRVNKLSPSFLRGKPRLRDRWPTLLRGFAQSRVWVAHNAPFDLAMLRAERERVDNETGTSSQELVPRALVLDTIGLDCLLNPDAGSRALEAVCPRWGVRLVNGHRADADAIACGRLLAAMAPRLSDDPREVRDQMRAAQQAWKEKRRHER